MDFFPLLYLYCTTKKGDNTRVDSTKHLVGQPIFKQIIEKVPINGYGVIHCFLKYTQWVRLPGYPLNGLICHKGR